MIACKDHNILWIIALDDINILINRICCPRIPLIFRYALAGGENIKAFVALIAEEVPAALQMTDQAMGFVLRGHTDAADA